MNLARWDQRIRRADELAAAEPSAAAVLGFYRQVAACQKALYRHLLDLPAADLDALASRTPRFLAEMQSFAPEPIARAAAEWRKRDARELLETCQSPASAVTGPDALLAWLALQPYLEHLADRSASALEKGSSRLCPFCGRKPIVAVLRPEGDGGKRSLICAWCATEWGIGRILCVACGEESPGKLSTYTAAQIPHVRVEACDTCRCYLKTVDLTVNGRAVPVVDELATLPLNLWAEQQGYVKLHANILGL